MFNGPQNIIVWDVGHQYYTHRLLTGRFNEFHTLRQKDGISGFPGFKESTHDVTDTGHFSISSTTGFAVANKVKGKQDSMIAVIGMVPLIVDRPIKVVNNIGNAGYEPIQTVI